MQEICLPTRETNEYAVLKTNRITPETSLPDKTYGEAEKNLILAFKCNI
jgi:hypothetical protein